MANSVFNLSNLNGTNGFAINGINGNGINANDYSGFSVSSAGDINGDGTAILILKRVCAISAIARYIKNH